MKNTTRYTLILLSLSLFIAGILTQRGGSRSHSSSSSSSHSRSRFGSHYGSSMQNSNCTTIDGVTTCTYTNSDSSSWSTILIFCGIFAAFCFCAIKKETADNQRRKRTIAQQLNKYEANMEAQTSYLGPTERQQLIDQFMSKKYTMVINVRDKSQKFFCQIQVTDLKKENENKFSIAMNGSDQVGSSKFEGILLFKGNGLGLKLSKVYDDRTKAEQQGSFDILLYEGGGLPDKIDGTWAFFGHETSLQYSGNWSMMEI